MISEYDGKTYSVNDYEQIVKNAIETKNINTLIEHSEKLKRVGCEQAPSAMSLDPQFTIESWMEFLNRNGSNWAKERLCDDYLIKRDYDMASWIIESFINGLEKRGEFVSPMLYYQIGYYKYLQIPDDILSSGEMQARYKGKILSVGEWYKKAIAAGYNPEDISEGKWCIDVYNRWKQGNKEKSKSKEGCYIATAVYGSYNCSEVWTLRRCRDYKLKKSFWGRLFIKAYYATSPKVVKRFGETQWFNHFWKVKLDKMVKKLEAKGFENTPYDDED